MKTKMNYTKDWGFYVEDYKVIVVSRVSDYEKIIGSAKNVEKYLEFLVGIEEIDETDKKHFMAKEAEFIKFYDLEYFDTWFANVKQELEELLECEASEVIGYSNPGTHPAGNCNLVFLW